LTEKESVWRGLRNQELYGWTRISGRLISTSMIGLFSGSQEELEVVDADVRAVPTSVVPDRDESGAALARFPGYGAVRLPPHYPGRDPRVRAAREGARRVRGEAEAPATIPPGRLSPGTRGLPQSPSVPSHPCCTCGLPRSPPHAVPSEPPRCRPARRRSKPPEPPPARTMAT
jgi:hypothetical protein